MEFREQGVQGLKNMAAVNTAPSSSKTIQVTGYNPETLRDDLYSFYSRFEIANSTQLEENFSSLKPGHTALTFLVMKAIEIVVKNYIINKTELLMDPFAICILHWQGS